MAKDLSKTLWHGVPRMEIPWYPTVDMDACIGCELCFVTCGRDVYEIETQEDGRHKKAVVENAYNCMVGCSTCSMVCPTQAISFPTRDVVWNIEREHKIFQVVHQEAAAKRDRAQPDADQREAIAQVDATVSRLLVRVAGHFGEKRILVKLEELIKHRPFDIEDLRLEVPTLKGLSEGAPAYMTFQVTSTHQEDVREFVEEVRTLITLNGLVWVEDH